MEHFPQILLILVPLSGSVVLFGALCLTPFIRPEPTESQPIVLYRD